MLTPHPYTVLCVSYTPRKQVEKSDTWLSHCRDVKIVQCSCFTLRVSQSFWIALAKRNCDLLCNAHCPVPSGYLGFLDG